MKHIKTYESFDIDKLKKYAVWLWKEHVNNYDIIEITDIIDDIFWCKDIYVYNNEDGIKFIDSKKSVSFSYELDGDSIIYTSDDLNECLVYLKMIIKSSKYNL